MGDSNGAGKQCMPENSQKCASTKQRAVDSSVLPSGVLSCEEHPSLAREDVSNEALHKKFAPKNLKTSSIVASAATFGALELWIFAIQFLPDAFVFDGESFSQLMFFQDVSFTFYVIGVFLPVVLKKVSDNTWFTMGTALLAAVPIWICCYMAAVMLMAPSGVLGIMSLMAHMISGLSLGFAFCNWIRFFVLFSGDTPLQIGLAAIFAALGGMGMILAPPPVRSVAVTLLPLFVMATLLHLRTVSKDQRNNDVRYMLNPTPIKADKRLWVEIVVTGLIYGACFGFAISDYSVTWFCSISCTVALAILGIIVVAYFLKTGKNPGYTLPSAWLMALMAMGQGLLSIFRLDYLPATFSLIFLGRLLFQFVLLLQLPRIFEKTQTLTTFFALWGTLLGAQLAGVLCRNFLWTGLSYYAFRGVSALFLCLVIGAMVYTLHDNSLSTVWGLLPIPSRPRKRYASACARLKEQYALTPREMEIMMMVGRGRNGTFIQEKLLISKSTYQTHMRNLYKKLDIHSDQELIDLIELSLEQGKLDEEPQ